MGNPFHQVPQIIGLVVEEAHANLTLLPINDRLGHEVTDKALFLFRRSPAEDLAHVDDVARRLPRESLEVPRHHVLRPGRHAERTELALKSLDLLPQPTEVFIQKRKVFGGDVGDQRLDLLLFLEQLPLQRRDFGVLGRRLIPPGCESLLDGLLQIRAIGKQGCPAVEDAGLDLVDHPCLQGIGRNHGAPTDGRSAHVIAAVDVPSDLAPAIGVALKPVAAVGALDQPVSREEVGRGDAAAGPLAVQAIPKDGLGSFPYGLGNDGLVAIFHHDAFFVGSADVDAARDVLAFDERRVSFRALLDGQPVMLPVTLATVKDGAFVGGVAQDAADGRMEPMAASGRLDPAGVQPRRDPAQSPPVLHELGEDLLDDLDELGPARDQLDLVALDLVGVRRPDAAPILDRRQGFEPRPVGREFLHGLVGQGDVPVLGFAVRTVGHPVQAVRRGSARPPTSLGQGASGAQSVLRQIDAVIVGLLALDDGLDEVRDVAAAANPVRDRVELEPVTLDLDEVRKDLLGVVEAAEPREFIDEDRDEVGVVPDRVGMRLDVAQDRQKPGAIFIMPALSVVFEAREDLGQPELLHHRRDGRFLILKASVLLFLGAALVDQAAGALPESPIFMRHVDSSLSGNSVVIGTAPLCQNMTRQEIRQDHPRLESPALLLLSRWKRKGDELFQRLLGVP